MSLRPLVTLALALALASGTTGCGKDEAKPRDTPGASSSAGPTGVATPTDGPSSDVPTASPSVAGLPSDFPAQQDVPLVPGVVTTHDSGTQSNGLMGWQLELETVGTQKGCFDRAAAVLVAAGFKKRAAMTAGDTVQAQYTTEKFAVIISSRSDGQNCELGYEVGQLAK